MYSLFFIISILIKIVNHDAQEMFDVSVLLNADDPSDFPAVRFRLIRDPCFVLCLFSEVEFTKKSLVNEMQPNVESQLTFTLSLYFHYHPMAFFVF